jgi:hypothetical protein
VSATPTLSRRGPGGRGLLALGLLASLSLSAGHEVHAFKHYTQGDELVRWWRRELIFHLAEVAPEEGDLDTVQALAQRAFDAWTDTACGLVPPVTFAGRVNVVDATSPATVKVEPDNVIVFSRSAMEWQRKGRASTWIAVTLFAPHPSTGEMIDADIIINDGGFRFSYDDTPDPGEIDFLSMLTHEVGHFFGMDHSADVDATMYANYANNDRLAGRTLGQDDIDGICALYTDVPEHVEGGTDDGCCSGGPASLAGLGGLVFVRAMRRRRRD